MTGTESINRAAFEGATSPAPLSGERELENGLRPNRLDEFVGQRRAVDNLRVAIGAALGRGESLDHVLLCGPPGLGKTSLARILAAELGTRLHSTSGPALERPKDLVGILTDIQRREVLFIDEVHRVPAAVEEYLYTAMEDFSVEFTLDQGPNARILTLPVQPFTLVGATTREGLLSAPFRARFGLLERLDPYPIDELVRILSRSAGLLAVALAPEAAALVAARSRGTPRVANRFLRRVRDLAQVRSIELVDEALAAETLARLGVDGHGLEEMDRRVLGVLARHAPQAVGLKTVAAAVSESEDTIEEVYEPHLLRCGFLERTARGRRITRAGLLAIGARPGASDGLFD